jgi:PilZ domain
MRVPTGRLEDRIAKAEVVELLYMDELPMRKHRATIENVSPRGARVITSSMCAPGKPVLLEAPEEHLKLRARVVYCQRLAAGKFAVGLQLDTRVEKWQKPPQL